MRWEPILVYGHWLTTSQEENVNSWLPLREAYLKELMSHEGRGYDPPERCPDCSVSPAIYQCKGCFGRELVCKDCIVKRHKLLPFHRIQVKCISLNVELESTDNNFSDCQQWNGSFFESVSLKSVGLVIQLNHRGQRTCSNPEANTGGAFTIIDLDAIHSISLNFCACGYGSQSRYIQLLRAGLFPVTSEHPRAAITFRTLELFELLSYESKVSAYEYHRTLLRLTDNTGMKTPSVRYINYVNMLTFPLLLSLGSLCLI